MARPVFPRGFTQGQSLHQKRQKAKRERRNRLNVVLYHDTARFEWTLLPGAEEARDHVALGNYLIKLGTEIRQFPPLFPKGLKTDETPDTPQTDETPDTPRPARHRRV